MASPDGADPSDPTPDPGAESTSPGGGGAALEGLRAQLRRMERLLDAGARAVFEDVQDVAVPAWRRVTRGEARWPVSLAVLATIAMQVTLPNHLALHPRWLLPTGETLLLLGLVVANPRRIDRQSTALRTASMVLILLMSLANAVSAGRLIVGLVHGTEHEDAAHLLVNGGAIWLTNVIVFALWYWQLDRGGPVGRALNLHPHIDFMFPQMATPDLAPPGWEPNFVDYLYLSFTNGTAFSPTDVLPLSRWAKVTMMGQSCVSLATVALVIARAVNILG